jgi:enoyl-CoA hydratase
MTGNPARLRSKGDGMTVAGSVALQPAGEDGIARVQLSNPGKRNAITVAMWQRLREVFEALQKEPVANAARVVVLSGAGGHFAAGADISEFPSFRFDADTLRHYHEQTIAPALQALLDCDITLLAQIDGNCIGGGLEIAACCDIRICARGSRFGVPIAKLGFPLAPHELQAVRRVVNDATLRELLLEARLYSAEQALARGLVHAVVEPAELAGEAQARVERIAALAPLAARANKRGLRQLAAGGTSAEQRRAHFDYAASADHREGIAAFLARRSPRFHGR